MIEEKTILRLKEVIAQLESPGDNLKTILPYITYDLKIILSELTGSVYPKLPEL